MDKFTSVLAAFEAGKLPSTQQLTDFIDFVNNSIITHEPLPTSTLSAQGRLLAEDTRRILQAYKVLGCNKNGDNILQEAVWHLNQGDLPATTTELVSDKDAALEDIKTLRLSLRTLLSIVWSSTSAEGVALTYDFFSFIRLALANVAELVETQAARAKQTLREVEEQVKEGQRDYLGRDRKRLEQEQTLKIQFEQNMDTVKRVGAAAIEAGQEVSTTVHGTTERTISRLQEAFYKICDKTQDDPAYQQAIQKIVGILKARLSQSIQTIEKPEDLTIATFINDPTPEQHVPKAIDAILQFFERISPLSELLNSFRLCLLTVIKDRTLSSYFQSVFDFALKNLTEKGYARSEAAQNERQDLATRWRALLDKDAKWRDVVEHFRTDLANFTRALQGDEDLRRLRDAHLKFGRDVEMGLIQARHAGQARAESGLQAMIDRATWFYQDMFRVYAPRILAMLKHIPIPRTEYVDPEIELVLESLDISNIDLLPSHIYIRNITDVDIKTTTGAQSRAAYGTLTHVRIQALQLQLDDVSFYYRDKNAATVSPAEYTGLVAATLPPQGVTVDLRIRLIPTTHMKQREEAQRYTVLEHVSVDISQDIGIDVKKSNHSLLLSVFKPIMVLRLRDALERSLTEQIRWLVGWIDGIAWDIGKRREVFEDAGVGLWASIVGAIMSEVGRMRRGGRKRGEVEWHATGTGLIVEHQPALSRQIQPQVGPAPAPATGIQNMCAFAVGAEPQILPGSKRGPLGTCSESLSSRLHAAMGDAEVTIEEIGTGIGEGVAEARGRAQGLVSESKRQVEGFRKTVELKARRERSVEGWRSSAFDMPSSTTTA
ncbi:hypothetical protein AX16_007857 [Volvariella volvacea WC 439]|nr:hypothetical protein AX16_007857 [Volvariella volvacea WC 439]